MMQKMKLRENSRRMYLSIIFIDIERIPQNALHLKNHYAIFSAMPENTPKYNKKWLIETVKSFGFAIFLVLIIRSSIVEAFKIPSGSMIPTLLVAIIFL